MTEVRLSILPDIGLGGEATGANPTDRGKEGTKRHLLVDGHGVPLSLVVSGANLNDCKGLEPVLDSIRIDDDHPAKMRRDLLLAKTHPASFSTAQLYR